MPVGQFGSILLGSKRYPESSRRTAILIFCISSVLYFLSIRFGLLFTSNQISPVWVATGFSIALLLIFGNNYWPALSLALVVSNYLDGNTPFLITAITVANTLEALLGAWAIKKIFGKLSKRSPHASSLSLILGSLAAAILSASLGVLAFCLNKNFSWSAYPFQWLVWMSSNFLGAILVLPFLLSCFAEDDKQKTSLPHQMGLLMVGLGLGYLLLLHPEGTPFLFLIFPYLYWSILILSDRSAKFGVILCSLIAVLATRLKVGPFHLGGLEAEISHLKLILLALGLSALALSDFKRIDMLHKTKGFLLGGWLVAGLIYFTTYSLEQQKTQGILANMYEDAATSIQHQLKAPLTILRSGAAYFDGSELVTKQEWEDYIGHFNISELSSALRGVGVLKRIPKTQLGEFIKQTRLDNAPNFQIRPIPKGDHQNNTEAFVLTFIEPLTANKEAIGLDMATESKRFRAAELATDTGELAISESIKLTTNPSRDSFLIFYPLYSHGPRPQTLTERRARSVGWICIPVFVQEFFAEGFGDNDFKNLSYAVTEEATGKTLTTSKDFTDDFSVNQVKLPIKLANQSYILYFKPSALFNKDRSMIASLAGTIAAILTLLLSAITSTLQSEKKRISILAEERTRQIEMAGRMVRLGSWDLDLKSQRLYWSKLTKEIHGVPEDYAPKVESAISFYKEGKYRDKITLAVNECIQKGTPFDLESEFVTAEGQTIWVRSMGQAHREQGETTRIFGAFQDITQLLQLERENAFLIESLKLGIWKYNPITQALHWDKSMYSLFDLAPEDFSGHYSAWENSLTEESKELAVKDLQLALLGKKEYDTTFQIETKERSIRHIGGRGVVLRDEKGVAQNMFGINWDRTKEVLLEQELIKEQAKTLQTAKLASLGEVSAGIAHEINNPLAIISGSVELLYKFINHPEKMVDKAKSIEKATARINKIVSGLKRFSSTTSHNAFINHSLSKIAQEAISLVSSKAQLNDTPILCDFKSQYLIFCDNFEIEQVLINLLNNAVDAVKGSDQRWVKVEVYDEAQSVVLRVTDSGPGISGKIKDKLFDPFFTTKPVGEGTGLGLSISKGILDTHKATIAVVAEHAHTCFEIRFNRVEVIHAT